MVGVRTERLKYIHYPHETDDIDEMYDLAKDPHEMNNLIDEPAYAEERAMLKRKLAALMEELAYSE